MRSLRRIFGISIATVLCSVALVLASGGGVPPGLTALAGRMFSTRNDSSRASNARPVGRAAAQRQLVQSGGQETVGVPWVGAAGVEESVSEIMAREAAVAPTRSRKVKEPRPEHQQNRRGLPQNPGSPAASRWPLRAGEELSAEREFEEPRLPQTAGVSFVGATLAETGSLPPDSMGDAGPTQLLVAVNGRIKVFDKQGNLGSLNADIDVFFASVRGSSAISDPRVRYDRLTGRWFLTIITTSTPNKILLAVSSSSTITDSSSFTFFSFQHDLVGATPNSDTNRFADYDTLGVDANALYIGVNIFNGKNFQSTTGFVVQKSSLLSGGSIVVTAFRQLGTQNLAGLFTPQGVDNDDPSATEGYFIGVDTVSFGLLQIRRISNPGGTPAISENISTTVPQTSLPMNPPVLGSTKPLDGSDDRLFMAKVRRDKITNQLSLWTTHNIQVDTTGTAVSSGGQNAMRWYQITNLTTTPTLAQSGTLFDPVPANPAHYWMGSAAMSGQGHMAIASSVAGNLQHAEIAAAGRLASDPLGTTQAPTVVQTSSFTYNVQPSASAQRWGDYSVVSVDPNDDMTFWTVQEYSDANNSYAVQVIQLKAPPPATPSAASPSSLSAGVSSTNVIVTGASIGGSGFFDPGSDFPNHISASVTNGVTVNSVTFTDPAHITVNLSTVGATSGAATITVTNPDGQFATSASGIITITGGVSLPSISGFNPTSGSVGTPVVISGSNFTGPTSVAFNGTNATVFNVDSASQITANVPSGATTGSIAVTTPAGMARSATNFTVTAATGFEADVFPRPSGDNIVSIADWVQVGRFAAALDTAAPGIEFQKADCAPKESLGNGVLSIADWVQAGRYAAGLDPVVAAGGPSAPSPSASRSIRSRLEAAGQRRLLIAVNRFHRAQLNEVKIRFKSLGNENALGFTLVFDPSVVSFSGVTTVNGATDAALDVNANDAANGRVGFALALSAGKSFSAGNYNILKIQFQALPVSAASTTFVGFGDGPVVREAADVNAVVVPIIFQDASVPVRGHVRAAKRSSRAAEPAPRRTASRE